MAQRDEGPGVEHPELADLGAFPVFRIIGKTLAKLTDRTAIILWSSFALLMLWGKKGDATLIFPERWRLALFPDLAWRDQLVSFVLGFMLLVVIPCCIIKFGFRQRLSEYGLGWPKEKTRLGLRALLVTFAIALPFFWLGTRNPPMQEEYPLFREAITTWGSFIIYELIYLLFFITIEFIFRGYLLFGLYGAKDAEAPTGVGGEKGPLVFGLYAVLIQMLAYTMWHIYKPWPEYAGAIFWGVAVAAVALRVRSIWPIIVSHWLLNVFLDAVLWLKS